MAGHRRNSGSRFAAALLAMLFCATILHAQDKAPDDKRAWVPAAASNTEQVIDANAIRLDVVVTPTPKATADRSKFTRRYVIELEKYNISNDGTHAVETSKGINAAIQDAYKNGANYIVFPRGTYLISELDPIRLDIKNAIIDLNGAVIQINTNGLQKYSTIVFDHGSENLRLTNGTLRGDKDTHDYAAGGEWGSGLVFESGTNLEADHLTLTNFMGDGVISNNGVTGKGGHDRYYYLTVSNVEQGAFSADGKPIASTTKTRTIKPYDITIAKGEFEFGYTAGYLGFPFVKGRAFQVYFYTDDMKLISKKDCFQYKKVTVPNGAKWVQLEYNQPEVLGEGSNGTNPNVKDPYYAFISNFKAPVDVHFHDNHVIGNRRLGMAYCGGQRWVIENNMFEANGGTAPGYGVDFEGGWLLMQDVVFRNNKFKNNDKGDLVVCGGSELHFEGNVFEKDAYFWDAALSYSFINNVVKGGEVAFKTRTGHVTARDNYYENCIILIPYDSRGMNNGFYGDLPPTPPVLLENETLVNVKSFTGTYFNLLNSKLTNVKFFARDETQLIRLKNNEFKDTEINYGARGPKISVEIEGNQGEIQQKGAGLDRRVIK